jgi:hypothetical protein
MQRVLYVVAREHALLSGYLRTTVGKRASEEQRVEIKLDERRAERRRSGEARDPERRQSDRRLRPSLDTDLRSRGFAVVREGGSSSTLDDAEPPPAVWRAPTRRRQRAARAGRWRRAGWGIALVLLVALAASVVAWSVDETPAPPEVSSQLAVPPAPPIASPPAPAVAPPRTPTAAPPRTPPVAPRVTARTEAPAPPPAAARGEAAAPAVPPAKPGPVRIVSLRSSGVVLSVDPGARALVLEDRGAGGEALRLRIEVAPDARVARSERAERAEDPSRLFTETAMSLADVRRGDYVVVERHGPEGKEVASSVVVTFRPQ